MAAKKAAPKRRSAPPKTGGGKKARPCNTPEICKYLAELTVWLTWMHKDYTNLRIAMCNVESQAFHGTGVASKRFPPCGGGMGGDPIAPPPPPKWT